MSDSEPKLISATNDETKKTIKSVIIGLVFLFVLLSFLFINDNSKPGEYNFFKGNDKKIAADSLLLTSMIGSIYLFFSSV